MARKRKDAAPSGVLAAGYEVEEMERLEKDSAILEEFDRVHTSTTAPAISTLPTTSEARRRRSRADHEFNLSEGLHLREKDTVLYLAYGSNMSDEKFKGDRGINPLSSMNVQVPELQLTFDLAGIPYLEPCFANSARRSITDHKTESPAQSPPATAELTTSTTTTTTTTTPPPRNPTWNKPMIGVVYELTARDFAKVLMTEGAGTSYTDIVVSAYPFARTYDPTDPVSSHPTTEPFKAHTLFAPRLATGSPRRRVPGYAQPSARYLGLLTMGAAQRGLPVEYRDYLASLQPYTVTTRGQRIGRRVTGYTWPVFKVLFGLGHYVCDETGRGPWWFSILLSGVFNGMWRVYDWVGRPLCGDGERTLGT